MTDIDKALETLAEGHQHSDCDGRGICTCGVAAALATIEAELARLRGLLDEASETIRSLSGDAFRLRAERERDEAVAALREVAEGSFDDVDPDDGLHRRSVRRYARQVLERLFACDPHAQGMGVGDD